MKRHVDLIFGYLMLKLFTSRNSIARGEKIKSNTSNTIKIQSWACLWSGWSV